MSTEQAVKERTVETTQWEQNRKEREEQIRRIRIEGELDEKEQRAKNSQEIQQLRLEEEHQLNKRRAKKRRWFNFFSKWFFIGLASIATGVVLDAFWQPQGNTFVAAISHVLPGLFSTIGVALMVGAIFDFAKNSENFMNLVTDILSEVVVSKGFLTMLSDKSKEEALDLILRPSNKQIKQYPNINALFKKRLDEFSTMFDINFKTNVSLEVRAYKGKSKIDGKKKIYCRTTLTQTIYKIGEEFKPLEIHCEKQDSMVESVIALPPEGDTMVLTPRPEKRTSGGIECDVYCYDIPKDFCKYDHLVIKRIIVEPGFDHWINYYWQSITPYEGVVFSLSCEEGLTVKDYMVFDNKAAYHVIRSEDGRRLEITSSQWLDTDTGFAITISDTPDSGDTKKARRKPKGHFFRSR